MMVITIFDTFVAFLLGGIFGSYVIFASGLIVLNNIIYPDAQIKAHQSMTICKQLENRDCEMKYMKIYISKGN